MDPEILMEYEACGSRWRHRRAPAVGPTVAAALRRYPRPPLDVHLPRHVRLPPHLHRARPPQPSGRLQQRLSWVLLLAPAIHRRPCRRCARRPQIQRSSRGWTSCRSSKSWPLMRRTLLGSSKRSLTHRPPAVNNSRSYVCHCVFLHFWPLPLPVTNTILRIQTIWITETRWLVRRPRSRMLLYHGFCSYPSQVDKFYIHTILSRNILVARSSAKFLENVSQSCMLMWYVRLCSYISPQTYS